MANKESTPASIHPGTVLCERYRIERQLAKGGMATIYLATDDEIDEPVAVKVLYDKYSDNDVVRARFVDEGRIQSMLDHPNVVHVLDTISDPLSFVMEYVDGETLENYLQREGPLDEEEIVDFILPVMSAIGFAHSKGIVHRDLKPSNVLLDDSGGYLKPKIMDFGVAKVHQGKELTEDGTTVGTLHYMSPEQIVGSREIDGRADIYSLGCSLYKLATGEVPFNASSEFALMMAQVEASPTPPSESRSEISDQLEQIILKALSKQPDERFQTIKAMTSALIKLRGDSSPDDTITRQMPADLLEFAMEADEVVRDQTDEVRLVPTTDDSETIELDAEDIETATQTMELSKSAIREIASDRTRAKQRKDGETRSLPKIEKDGARDVHAPADETVEQSVAIEKILRTTDPGTETVEREQLATTTERDAPGFGKSDSENSSPTGDSSSREDSGSRGIIAVDNPDVDSREVTDLHEKERLEAGGAPVPPDGSSGLAETSEDVVDHEMSTIKERPVGPEDKPQSDPESATARHRPSVLSNPPSEKSDSSQKDTSRQRPTALRNSSSSQSEHEADDRSSQRASAERDPTTIPETNDDDAGPSNNVDDQPGDQPENESSGPQVYAEFRAAPEPTVSHNPNKSPVPPWAIAIVAVVAFVAVVAGAWFLLG